METIKNKIISVKDNVTYHSIKDICNIDGVDGVLIGGASNNAENLLKMYNLVKNM